MPISSLIVRTASPEVAASLRDTINAIGNCSVERIVGADLVVVTETVDIKDDKFIWDQLEMLGTVKSLELIYHNFEDLEETNL